MILRADHIAGGAFVVFGIAVIALSGDLPAGQLSMPGSGFLPKIIATLCMVFGVALIARAAESPPFAQVSWNDGKHAAFVTIVTAGAVAFYTVLGFIATMVSMLVILLVVSERRDPIRAGLYSVAVVVFTFTLFEYVLKTPLPTGVFGY